MTVRSFLRLYLYTAVLPRTGFITSPCADLFQHATAALSFAEEISEINGLLNFYLQTDFDVDAVFGTYVCTAENDDTLNVYANYDMAAGEVCDELEVDLHWADGREEAVPYTLNAAEKEVLRWKMDEYCQEQTGMTLEDYSAQLMLQDMEPSAPSM